MPQERMTVEQEIRKYPSREEVEAALNSIPKWVLAETKEGGSHTFRVTTTIQEMVDRTFGRTILAMHDEIDKRDDLIRRLAEAIRENWEDMWRNIGIEELYEEAEAILGPARNPFFGVGTIEIQPLPEPLTCKTHLEGEWIDEAGTHDGGTVPEGDRSSTGPASARESEGHSE